MLSIRVQLGERSYDIAVTSGDPAGLGPFARQRARGSRAFVVTDGNTWPHGQRAAEALTASGFAATTVVLPAGEAQKSLETASRLYDQLAEVQADRKTLIVPVGGGVLGDLAGFVA